MTSRQSDNQNQGPLSGCLPLSYVVTGLHANGMATPLSPSRTSALSVSCEPSFCRGRPMAIRARAGHFHANERSDLQMACSSAASVSGKNSDVCSREVVREAHWYLGTSARRAEALCAASGGCGVTTGGRATDRCRASPAPGRAVSLARGQKTRARGRTKPAGARRPASSGRASRRVARRVDPRRTRRSQRQKK